MNSTAGLAQPVHFSSHWARISKISMDSSQIMQRTMGRRINMDHRYHDFGILRVLLVFSLLAQFIFATTALALKDDKEHFPGSDKEYNGLLIGLALSGGGFRSAAFSYGAMLELAKTNLCVLREKIDTDYRYSVKIQDNHKCLAKSPTLLPFEVVRSGSLLDSIDVISTVSGGSITGGYYALKGRQSFLDDDQLRKDLWPNLEDFGSRIKPDFWGLLRMVYRLSKQEDGLIDHSTIQEFYRTFLFGDKTFDDVRALQANGSRKPLLLINATELSSQRIFTFYYDDLKCITEQKDRYRFTVAEAVTASGAQPGIISAVKLPNLGNPSTMDDKCSRLYGNKITVKDLILVDGGVYDNLAVDGLIRYFINLKREVKEAAASLENIPNDKSDLRLLIIAVNAEIPSVPTGGQDDTAVFPVAQRMNDSVSLMMNHRTDVTKFLFRDLETYGIKVVEINFRDFLNDRTLLQAWIEQVHQQDEMKRPFDARSAYDLGAKEVLALTNLNALRTLIPTSNELDSVVTAGRVIVRNALNRGLQGTLDGLLKREYAPECQQVLDMATEFCWPLQWEDRNPYDEPLGTRLSEMERVTHSISTPHFSTIVSQLERLVKRLPYRLRKEEDQLFALPVSNSLSAAHRAYQDALLLRVSSGAMVQAIGLKDTTIKGEDLIQPLESFSAAVIEHFNIYLDLIGRKKITIPDENDTLQEHMQKLDKMRVDIIDFAKEESAFLDKGRQSDLTKHRDSLTGKDLNNVLSNCDPHIPYCNIVAGRIKLFMADAVLGQAVDAKYPEFIEALKNREEGRGLIRKTASDTNNLTAKVNQAFLLKTEGQAKQGMSYLKEMNELAKSILKELESAPIKIQEDRMVRLFRGASYDSETKKKIADELLQLFRNRYLGVRASAISNYGMFAALSSYDLDEADICVNRLHEIMKEKKAKKAPLPYYTDRFAANLHDTIGTVSLVRGINKVESGLKKDNENEGEIFQGLKLAANGIVRLRESLDQPPRLKEPLNRLQLAVTFSEKTLRLLSEKPTWTLREVHGEEEKKVSTHCPALSGMEQ